MMNKIFGRRAALGAASLPSAAAMAIPPASNPRRVMASCIISSPNAGAHITECAYAKAILPLMSAIGRKLSFTEAVGNGGYVPGTVVRFPASRRTARCPSFVRGPASFPAANNAAGMPPKSLLNAALHGLHSGQFCCEARASPSTRGLSSLWPHDTQEKTLGRTISVGA